MTPYYQDGSVTIYLGDCREVLPTLDPVDLVVTSPPYNIGDKWPSVTVSKSMLNGYGSYRDNLPHDEYVGWQQSILQACWDKLTDDGAIFYNHKPRHRNGELILPLELNPGLPLRQIITWDRGIGMNWTTTHFLPVSEWVVLLAKPNFRLTDKTASHASDVWRFAPESGVSGHPCPFPLALPKRCIVSTNAMTVLDPFMGSGTTLRAAKDLGRKAIGIEIDERYCELAVARMAQEVLF